METFLLLLLMAGSHSVSTSRLCPVTGSSVNLNEFQHLLVHTSEITLRLVARNPRCGLHTEVELDFGYIRAAGNDILKIYDDNGRVWYDMMLSFENDQLSVILQGMSPYPDYERRVYSLPAGCLEGQTLNVTFKNSVDLALVCNVGDSLYSSFGIACENGAYNSYCEDEYDPNVHTTPAYRNRGYNKPTYTSTSYSRNSYYYTPLGIISLILIIGLRYCIWKACQRPTTVVERVRTVTVVRRIHVPSTPLSTSSSANTATEPTPADPTDLPPSYMDIENENPPPAYSELDIVKMPADAPKQLSEEELPPTPPSSSLSETTTDAVGATATETENAQLSETESKSAISRVLASAPRSLRSQFAFKPMKEEE